MRADRLLDLIALLRRHRRLTAAQLAERLGVCRRTVLRDLDALSLSGVPVFAEHGRGGGFSILPGYRPELSGLTPDELTALFLPGGEQAADALGRGPAFRSARRKLEATVSDDLAHGIGDLSSWLLVVPEGWGTPVAPPDAVPALATASARHEVIDIIYQAKAEPAASRRVRPLGLVLAARTWYLLALRDDSGQQRTYRADRVSSVSLTGDRFEPTLDLRDAWQNARESLLQRETITVVLHAEEDALPIVTYVASLAGRVIAVGEPQDGRVRIEAVASHLATAAGLLAGIGHLADIQEPPELIEAIVAVSRRNLVRYGAWSTQPFSGGTD